MKDPMSRIAVIILLLIIQLNVYSQEIFSSGIHYGVRYDNCEYAPIFDEVVIKDYFVYGRIGSDLYNLNPSKKHTDRIYRKFNFEFDNKLLVIGETSHGTIDIMNESGDHFYLFDGPYDKVVPRKRQDFYGNDDLLVVKKDSKKGLYHWTSQKEILAPNYDKIHMHESCQYGSAIIYAKAGGENFVFDHEGQIILKFKGNTVSNVYPSEICKGYMIQWEHKIGYLCKMDNDLFFLIRPKYDAIYFPFDDPGIIVVKNRDRFGLFYNYRTILKCRYEQIEVLDHPYQLAIVEKRGIKKILMRNGELVPYKE